MRLLIDAAYLKIVVLLDRAMYQRTEKSSRTGRRRQGERSPSYDTRRSDIMQDPDILVVNDRTDDLKHRATCTLSLAAVGNGSIEWMTGTG